MTYLKWQIIHHNEHQILSCDIMQSRRQILSFRRNMLLPSSGMKYIGCASVTQESWKTDVKKRSTFWANGNSRYNGTSQGHNFDFLYSILTNVNQALFLYSSYRSQWWSSLQAVSMIKPISHLEGRGTCSSETSVSTYKPIRCRNPKDHNMNNHINENLKIYTVMTSKSYQHTVYNSEISF